MSDALLQLAELIRARNTIHTEIAALIGRPALPGHVGEFLASEVFGIDLHSSAVHPGNDGLFTQAPDMGSSVNIKWYLAFCGLLDLNPVQRPDYYLVLTGPKLPPASSTKTDQRWLIRSVYLFQTATLFGELETRGVKIGIATSVRQAQWTAAEVYPQANNPLLPLTDEQRSLLSLFHD